MTKSTLIQMKIYSYEEYIRKKFVHGKLSSHLEIKITFVLLQFYFMGASDDQLKIESDKLKKDKMYFQNYIVDLKKWMS